ncbi:MAG: helix-turn-helix domain-containing protein [Bacteroidota bacterium]
MFQLLKPKDQELFRFPNHALIWIKSGSGFIEVDFKPYTNFEHRLIFLTPDQPIRFVYGTFEAAVMEFPHSLVSQSKEYRVLFKHLLSLGYVEFDHQHTTTLPEVLQKPQPHILSASTERWYGQNPFNARKEEYQLIFDVKDEIDAHFQEHRSISDMMVSIQQAYHRAHRLVKHRLGVSIKRLAQRKILLESQRDIAFTDKPIQEVAYDMGFQDPAYFHRFFKRHTKLTPSRFREEFGQLILDSFLQNLQELIQQHHRRHRSTSFYANQMNMSVPTLSRKLKTKLQLSMGQLISQEVIGSAKEMLLAGSIKETAFELGFEEANHFSSYFKRYTGHTPSAFLSKKSN